MKFKQFIETRFTTAQGSTYEFDSGKSIRNKSVHAFHSVSDFGVKPQSELTVFVNPGLAKEIGMWQTLSASKKRLILYRGHIILVSFNDIHNRHGLDKIIGDSSYVMEPEVGLCPLELFQQDMKNWDWLQPGMQVFAGSHPGSPITDIT